MLSFKKLFAIVALILCFSTLFLTGCEAENKSETYTPSLKNEKVISTLTEGAVYFADINIREYGTIKVKLYPEVAPETVRNFVELASSDFYSGLTFHRIIEGFMMQGGQGTEGAAKTIVGEFSSNGYENNLQHKRGVISMARTPDYNSATSQFFIVHQDSLFLDGEYAAFGEVVEGIEIVDKICTEANPTDGNGGIAAEAQPVIDSIIITEEK